MAHMQGQDWNPVVLRAKQTTTSQKTSKGAVAAALRSGAGVETNKKMNGGANAKAADGRKLFKLENDTETFAHETVSSSLKKQIQSARLAKKMTQAQLAQAINEKPQIINEYECGKAIPNPQILNKMSRVLGVKLKKSG